MIWNANDEGMTLRYRGIEQAARTLRLEVQPLSVREPDDFEPVAASGGQGPIIGTNGALFTDGLQLLASP